MLFTELHEPTKRWRKIKQKKNNKQKQIKTKSKTTNKQTNKNNNNKKYQINKKTNPNNIVSIEWVIVALAPSQQFFTYIITILMSTSYSSVKYIESNTGKSARQGILPFWCVFYVSQAIKTAARDLVLHGIVSQSNRPSVINGVRFYDCCSNINCRLSRSEKLQISILPEF